MGQSLTTYEYARLKDLPHYGDWSADFISGSLVYYEQYSDDSYGIDGGNLKSTLSKDSTIVGDDFKMFIVSLKIKMIFLGEKQYY